MPGAELTVYTLGAYNEALACIESDDGKRSATLHLTRTASRRLLVRDGRGGSDLFGVSIEDDGAVRVLTWNQDGEVSGVLVVREPERTARYSRLGAAVLFERLPGGSYRASAHGCELDVWQVATSRGHVWRWTTLGPDGRYRGTADCDTWEAAAAQAEAAAKVGS